MADNAFTPGLDGKSICCRADLYRNECLDCHEPHQRCAACGGTYTLMGFVVTLRCPACRSDRGFLAPGG